MNSNQKVVELQPELVESLVSADMQGFAARDRAVAVAAASRLTGHRFLTSVDAIRAVVGTRQDPGAEEVIKRHLRSVAVPRPEVPQPFPVEVQKNLGVYVYVLVDPRTSQPFYVGKGYGNRVFQHVWGSINNEPPDTSEIVGAADGAAVLAAKVKLIREIFKAGFGVEHWIIRHRIEEDETVDQQAFAAEQCMIDFAWRSSQALVNMQGGHVSTAHGMHRAEELALRYCAEPIPPLPIPCALVKVNRASEPSATPEDVYAWGRESWINSEKARGIKGLPVLIFADDIVRAVHRADSWELAERTKKKPGSNRRTSWWRFTGNTDPELEKLYVGKSLREIRAQRPSGKWQQHGWHPYLESG